MDMKLGFREEYRVSLESPIYKLTRLNDGLIMYGYEVKWVEWDEDSRFKSFSSKPDLGYSLMVDPSIREFTWLTTTVTEIVSNTKTLVHFKTNNSEYKLEMEYEGK
jgi:hypothetical protein